MSKPTEWLKRAFGRASAHQANAAPAGASITSAERTALLGSSSLQTTGSAFSTALKMAVPYWTQSAMPERMLAWSMFAGMVATTMWSVGLLAQFSTWQGDMYRIFGGVFTAASGIDPFIKESGKLVQEATVVEHLKKFPDLLADFGIILAKFSVASGLSFAFTNYIGMRWRQWETVRTIEKYSGNSAYNRLPMIYGNPAKNPEEIIQGVVGSYTGTMVRLVDNTISAGLLLGTFGPLLYNIGNLDLQQTGKTVGMLMGDPGGYDWPDIKLEGYLFWIASGWALVGTGLIQKITSRLADLDREQKLREAELRANIRDGHDNSASIDLSSGIVVQKDIIIQSLSGVFDNAKKLIMKQKQYTIAKAFYGNSSVPLPYFASIPMVLAWKVKDLGGLREIAYNFGQVDNALSMPINNLDLLMLQKANVLLLSDMNNAIDISNRDLMVRDVLQRFPDFSVADILKLPVSNSAPPPPPILM